MELRTHLHLETKLNVWSCISASKRALKWYSKCYCVVSVMKTFTLKGIQLFIIQHFEQWIICTLLSVNIFVTIATQTFSTPL
jgi:hypothetical protein